MGRAIVKNMPQFNFRRTPHLALQPSRQPPDIRQPFVSISARVMDNCWDTFCGYKSLLPTCEINRILDVNRKDS